jgi:hypothetical protein
MFVRAILSSFRKTDNRANNKAHLTQLKPSKLCSVPFQEGRAKGRRKEEKEAGVGRGDFFSEFLNAGCGFFRLFYLNFWTRDKKDFFD